MNMCLSYSMEIKLYFDPRPIHISVKMVEQYKENVLEAAKESMKKFKPYTKRGELWKVI